MRSKPNIDLNDIVLPFQLNKSNIRGRFVRLSETLDKIFEQHEYPSVVEALVTEAAVLTVLIGQMVKLRWRLSLQIRGDGPIRLVATDYYGPTKKGEPGQIRAYASFDQDRIKPSEEGFPQIGSGYFAIIIDQGDDMKPYQGITPLSGESLASCAETYFAQSEQIPTKFSISYGKSTGYEKEQSWRSGGIMVQHMPNPSPAANQGSDNEEKYPLQTPKPLFDEPKENWSRVNILLNTAEEFELIGPNLSQTQTLVRLFNDEGIYLSPEQEIKFGCTCSEKKVQQTMSIYSTKDIKHMTKKDGSLTADCQFCGAHYILDPSTLGFEAPKLQK
ncbi:MAG: molecular chaperone Hsp33 [Paracoccaceae bacterium]|jgi:molecular chaperone Hsp33